MNTDYTQTETPRGLIKAAAAIEFPEWVEEISSRDELVGLSDRAFGDMKNRLYPIHNKSAAFYSMIDAASKPFDTSVATYERIDEACKRHGIADEVRPYLDLYMTSFEKSASTEEEHPYAIDYTVEGQTFKLLPIGERYLIEQAARDLTKMAASNRAPLTVVKEAVAKIVEAAEKHEADISDLDNQLASWSVERYPDFEKAASMIQSRIPFTREEGEAQQEYTSLIKKAEAGDISADECVDKLELIDAALDVPYSYHDSFKGVPTPHEVVYSGDTLDEIRKSATQNVLINDVLIPLEDIHSLDMEEMKFSISKQASDKLEGIQDKNGVELTMLFSDLEDDDRKEFLHAALRQHS